MPIALETTMFRRNRSILLTCGVAVLAFAMPAGQAVARELAADDAGFLKTAAQDNLSEVALGKLALDKSGRPDIKMFARQVVTDHEKANENLKALAGSKSVKLPDSAGMKNDAKKMRLQLLSGRDFDNDFVNTMVDDHKADIEKFRKEAGSAIDSDVKKFVFRSLPILKEHLTMIQTIQGQMATPNK